MRQLAKNYEVSNWCESPDPVAYCLECWRDWMRCGGARNLGESLMRWQAGSGDGHGPDLHEAQLSHDAKIGAATDTAIDSLPAQQRWAIYASCGVSTAWRYPNADLAMVAEEARQALAGKLKKNICTSTLF